LRQDKYALRCQDRFKEGNSAKLPSISADGTTVIFPKSRSQKRAALRVPKTRASYEATYFAGLRKAGMPEGEIIHYEDLERERFRDVHIHAIHDEKTMLGLGVSSKLNARPWVFSSSALSVPRDGVTTPPASPALPRRLG
jgi:hypothetical protein